MKLEVGKRYRDEAGRECEVVLDDGTGTDRFHVNHVGVGMIWHYIDGRANIAGSLNLIEEIKPAAKFKVGETYQTVARGEVKCVALREDGGMFATYHSEATSAYGWDADGNYLCALPQDCPPRKIVFPPVVERKTVVASVDYKYGVPDWSTAVVAG